MKTVALGIILYAVLAGNAVFGQGTNTTNNVTGQWDFNQGDLRATIGSPLQYLDGTQTITSFSTNSIGGAPAGVMHFPAASSSQGYLMLHGASSNGLGTNVNEYTIVMDLMLPDSGAFRALFNSDTNNVEDAIMFVNPDNGIGVLNNYAGELAPNTWYRLAFVFDLTNSTITTFINGQTNSTIFTGADSTDGPFSLRRGLLLFTDNDVDAAGDGYVNSIQFIASALNGEQVAALGGPSSGGIGAPPTPVGDVNIEKIEKVGSNIVLTVSGSGNLHLERTAALGTPTNWQNDSAVLTNGKFTVPATGSTGFFRVRRDS